MFALSLKQYYVAGKGKFFHLVALFKVTVRLRSKESPKNL